MTRVCREAARRDHHRVNARHHGGLGEREPLIDANLEPVDHRRLTRVIIRRWSAACSGRAVQHGRVCTMTHARRDGVSDLTIETVDHDGIVVMAFNGDIDITNAGQARTAIEEQLNNHPIGIVVYLAVGFLASTGLSLLGEAHRRAHQAGVGFAVVATARSPRRALLATGMDRILLLHETVPHAVEALRTTSS